MFEGPDITLALISELNKLRRSRRYRLFHSIPTFDLNIVDVFETVAFLLKIDSEYELHYRISYFFPASAAKNIKLWESSGVGKSVVPERPVDFRNFKLEYPRKATARTLECECENGLVRCPNCSATQVVTCPECHEYRSGKCKNCGGTGHVQCDKCRGSGKCLKCHGAGELRCPKCGGTGICQFCEGAGVKKCPTCRGDGKVLCPFCEGDGRVFFYTSDVFEYSHIVDEDKVLPTYFEKVHNRLYEPEKGIPLKELSRDEVKSKLGLINEHVLDVLVFAKKRFDALLEETKKRAFESDAENDHKEQEEVFNYAKKAIKTAWAQTVKDNYYAEFKLRLDKGERTKKGRHIYNKLLFQKYSYIMLPSSKLTFRLGDKRKELYAVGRRERFSLERPHIELSTPKVGGTLLLLVSLMLISTFAAWNLPPIAALLISMCLTLSISLLILVFIRKKPKVRLITLIGGSDSYRTTFSALLADHLSKQKLGMIIDEVYPKLIEHLLGKGLVLGASLSYSAILNNGNRIRIVSVSSASYKEFNSMTLEVLKESDALGVLINSKDDLKEAEEKIRLTKTLGIEKICLIIDDVGLIDKLQDSKSLEGFKTFILPFRVMKGDWLAEKPSSTPVVKSILEYWGVIGGIV